MLLRAEARVILDRTCHRAPCRADRDAAHSVTITVADRGAGIPLEIQSRIFDPFFTTKQKGSGLGLAIVAKNVRHLGGDVRLDSPLDGDLGTAITVTLPVEVA